MKNSAEAKYALGDKVQIASGKEHDAMTKGKVGTIVEISTPALGIKFDGMEGVHKWFTDSEVERVVDKPKSKKYRYNGKK